MVANILASVGLPLLIQAVKSGLSHVRHPAAQGVAEALDGLDQAIARGQVSEDELKEANRHIETMAAMKAESDQVKMEQINQSLRSEIASQDKYVRRMRPTFGYIMALTWLAQMLGIAYILVFDTGRADIVIGAMDSLGTIWTIGLSVLGIYVYKRSEDKKLFSNLNSVSQGVSKTLIPEKDSEASDNKTSSQRPAAPEYNQ